MPKPTAEERRHMGRVAELGCIICRRPAQLHHPLHGAGMGQKSPHMDVIPLCLDHHLIGDDAIHNGYRPWVEKHGTEAELLEKVRAKL